MKRFFRLVRHEFVGQGGVLLALLSLVALLEAILFGAVFVPASNVRPERFEWLVDGSGVPAVFALALVSVAGLGVLRLLRGFMSSKSIYALLTLPLSRRAVYMAKLQATLLDVLCLLSVQMVLTLAMHQVFAIKFADTMPSGSLYLSFMRSSFLKTILPPEPVSALTALLIMFTVAAYALGTAACIRSRKYKIPILIAVLTAYHAPGLLPLMRIGIGAGLLQLSYVVLILAACALMGADCFVEGEVCA